MRPALIFGDESDTVSPAERDVFVYALLGMGHATYETLQAEFWQLKRARRVAGEVKWARIGPQRRPFLELIARHAVDVRYFVADKRRPRGMRPDRYRYKILEAAFSGFFPLQLDDMPLVLLDERHEYQDREEAVVLRALADLVAGAMRAFESRGDSTWEVLKERTRRAEI